MPQHRHRRPRRKHRRNRPRQRGKSRKAKRKKARRNGAMFFWYFANRPAWRYANFDVGSLEDIQ